MGKERKGLAQQSPLTAWSRGAGIATPAQHISKARKFLQGRRGVSPSNLSLEPGHAQPNVSIQQPNRTQKEFHGPTHLDLKLRHTYVSFVKVGRAPSEEETLSTEEAATTTGGPFSIPSSAETSVHAPSLGRLGPQDSAALGTSTSFNHNETRDGFTQKPKQNEHASQREVAKPQGAILASFGGLPQHSDHLPRGEVQQRSSSPMSNSSEEIIIFGGRKGPAAKKVNATNRLASFVEGNGHLSGFMRSRPSDEVDLLSTVHERTSNSSRSTSPDGSALGGASFTRDLADFTKEGCLAADKPNAVFPMRRFPMISRNTRKYEILDNQLDKSDEDESSAGDQLSNVSENNPTGSGEQKILENNNDRLIDSPENEIKYGPDYKIMSRKDSSAGLKVISNQVSDPSVQCHVADERCCNDDAPLSL